MRLKRARHRDHLHWPGIIFVILTLLIGGAALQRGESLLIWVFASLLAWILVSGVISGWMMMGVRVRRIAPAHGEVGVPLRLRYEVSSCSRFWPIFDLRVFEPRRADCEAVSIMHCGVNESVMGEGVCVPTERGLLVLTAVQTQSGFPFGLLLKSVEVAQRTEILVRPRCVVLRRDALRRLFVGRGGEGRSSSVVRGAAEEFHGLRDYRTGDALRAVAWRRSASLAALVVIERSAPAPRRLSIALDLRLAEPPHTPAQEERAINMAASLLRHGQQSGWEIALRILGLAHSHTPARASQKHLLDLLDQLALIDLTHPRTHEGLDASLCAGKCVLITPGEPSARASAGEVIALSAAAIEALQERPT